MAEKLTIAEYPKLAEAENAVMVLDRKGFPMAQVSIMAEGVERQQDAEQAENFLVVVEGNPQDAEKAKEALEDTPAESIVTRQEEEEAGEA